MKKNGSFFVSIVDRASLKAAIWDPYSYREEKQTQTLGYFAAIHSLKGRPLPRRSFKFAPLEYRHIGRGHIPIFVLEPSAGGLQNSCRGVGEGALLFGTMRAYLGNVVVTPRAEWIGERNPLVFAVKSEFVQVLPKDGLVYFWWAYLQSQSFLHSLPIGTGGTRPRLQAASLGQAPVEVPSQKTREVLHGKIEAFAANVWSQYILAQQLLEDTIGI